MVQGVGSIGTTVAPLLGSYFILSRLKESQTSSEAVRTPYIVIGLFLLLIAFIVYRLKLPNLRAGSELRATQMNEPVTTAFSYRNLNFGVWAIFLYVGAEVSIGTFLTNYISDSLHIDLHQANHYV